MLELLRNILTISKKKFRKDKDFADALDVRRQTISNWRAFVKSEGKRGNGISQDQLVNVVGVLGVTEASLRGFKIAPNITHMEKVDESDLRRQLSRAYAAMSSYEIEIEKLQREVHELRNGKNGNHGG